MSAKAGPGRQNSSTLIGATARRLDPWLVRFLGRSWMSSRVTRSIGLAPVPTLLLRTTDEAGENHDSPVFYCELDGRPVVIGSRGGHTRDPRWVRNLRRDPIAEAWVRRKRRRVRAVELSGDERARALRLLTDLYPPYEEYQRTAGDRLLPVFRLDDSPDV